MLRKQLFFVALLAHIVSLCEGRTTQDQTFIGTPKTTDLHVNGSHRRGVIDLKRSTSKPVNSDTLLEDSGQKKPKMNGFYESCPYETKQLCLIFSLSRIANVHVAAPDQTNRSLKTPVFPSAWNDVGNLNEELRGNGYLDGQRIPVTLKKSPNVHCKAIRDVYIPEAKQNLPAFVCKFRDKTFVLSSTRFLQDRRLYLDINVDEDIFQNPKRVRKISRSNEFSVIPALLVLNVPNNDYRIEARAPTFDEGKVNPDERIDKKLSEPARRGVIHGML
nr:uncharacterized protein LOC117228820 [Megalopta genalis]